MLMILGDHPDCSQTELAEKLEISAAAVTVSLKKLERGGYIRRQCNEDDNRVNHVIITEKGREAIDMSKDFFHGIEIAAFHGFEEEELVQLENFLCRILENEDKIGKDIQRD